MPGTRVLVVDDSVTIHKILATVLGETDDLEVVGAASTGTAALAKIAELSPDVVILDVEMPVMDGLETLRRLRAQWPRLPVIMFSVSTERGATVTIEALRRGASDYLAKPSASVNALAHVRTELVPKIRALASPPQGTRKIPLAAARTTPIPVHRAAPVEIVAIGASTGGPNALAAVLAALPATFALPVVIVQHMLPELTAHLASRLAARARIEVVQASAGAPLVAGTAYVARGDHHLVVERRGGRVVIELTNAPPEAFCRPAVDVLFRSVARVYGAGALAVVLTGMGQDGLAGCERVHAAGGGVIVQDEATSVVWGMPGAVARAGLASDVVPLARIGDEIVRRTRADQLRTAAIPRIS